MPYYNTVPVRGVTTQRTVTFRGVRRHSRIREGEWSAAENLTSDLAPMLAVRLGRTRAATFPGEILALSSADPPAVLYRAENDPDAVLLRYGDATERFDCPAGEDPGGIVRMGAVLILPGLKVWVNTASGERGRLDAAFDAPETDITADGMRNPYVLKLCPCDETGTELRVFQLVSDSAAEQFEAEPERTGISDGECYGVGSKRLLRRYRADAAEKWSTAPHLLRLEADGIDAAGFRPGDFVRLSGLPVEWVEGVFVDDYTVDAVDPFWTHNRIGDYDDDPNGLHEIALVGEGFLVMKDVFYTRRVTMSAEAAAAVSVGRRMPELDFVVEAQNRLWGCRSGLADGKPVNELYASALGDWQSWERFSGLSTASWTASVGSEGPFTGAAVLDGCPVFFKADCVHRIYPAASGAHRVAELRLPGVAPGCARSLVHFDGGLCYVSHAGVVRWTGGSVTVLSEALGTLRPVSAAAGAWGHKLWVALTEQDGAALWVWDALRETWFTESGLPGLPVCFAAVGAHLYAAAGTALWDLLGRDGEPEDPVRWSCTSGLVGYAVTEQKYLSRFVVRLMLPRSSRMDIWLEYDSDGVWHHAGRLRGQGTGTFLLPVRPRRCDHFRLRLTGEGSARIYSIVKHMVRGSDKP